jgi:hypothetical protein
MENFTYYSPTLYEFGRGSEEKIGMLTFLTGASKVMIVYGQKYVKNNGLLDRITTSLNTLGIEWVTLGGVQPNPTDTLVYEGIKLARAKKVDGVLAVGGGSVIDTAKAIAAGTGYDGDFWDFFSGKAQVKEALPVGVLLTIPGSGSEGSGNAVITRSEDNVKLSLRTDSILKPRFAVVNPEMTFTLSARQTAIGIVDMMSHIMERYFSTTPRVEVGDRLCGVPYPAQGFCGSALPPRPGAGLRGGRFNQHPRGGDQYRMGRHTGSQRPDRLRPTRRLGIALHGT